MVEWRAFCEYPEMRSKPEAEEVRSVKTEAQVIQWNGWYGPKIVEFDRNIMVLQFRFAQSPSASSDELKIPYISIVFELGNEHCSQPVQPGHTGSPASLDRARSWFQGCLSSHQSCKSLSTQWCPTRLLQLNSDEVALVETRELDYREEIM